jgi:hypothetical protein
MGVGGGEGDGVWGCVDCFPEGVCEGCVGRDVVGVLPVGGFFG